MKKIVKLLLASGILVSSLFGCKKAYEGKFVLGLDASFPPMGFTEADGTITGYDIDLAKEVSKRLNLEFVAKPINWEAKELELSSGSIDCIWNGFTMTEERLEKMAFTSAYLNNDQILVVRNDGTINSLKDAEGKVIGCQSGSSAEEAIESNKEFASSLKSVKKYEDNLTALNDLEVGGIDAVVMDSVVADYTIKIGKRNLTVVEESLSKEAYGIGFRNDENGIELRDKVQKVLLEMAEDGTVAKISENWFGKDISVIGK
ncbi:MAG: amino acid ABC transporter substrate-binding protein [Spirochaetia bacterium]|nr:amino acid ABC transporter substrate-binding protein [Spirochaetia bacterium]MDD6930470.1 amino acid ABC transporter substrate-binding protein [Treponema sp.]MCI5608635.1 amino acid ABC transporter substrate-binding protein [Spirochaetia bacterium]MCI7799582.1 amino acid ABC transporter substrate-binding protein [Spirochaetia bacterium]MDY3887120.1 amino acid ABC transporter substrate-binding protein [Treponema sp.]